MSTPSHDAADALAQVNPELVAHWRSELQWRMRLERPEYDSQQFDSLIQRMLSTVAGDFVRAQRAD